jgi:hypothetical protein
MDGSQRLGARMVRVETEEKTLAWQRGRANRLGVGPGCKEQRLRQPAVTSCWFGKKAADCTWPLAGSTRRARARGRRAAGGGRRGGGSSGAERAADEQREEREGSSGGKARPDGGGRKAWVDGRWGRFGGFEELGLRIRKGAEAVALWRVAVQADGLWLAPTHGWKSRDLPLGTPSSVNLNGLVGREQRRCR